MLQGLAKLVTEEDLSLGRMYPPLSKIKNVSIKIATKVAEEAYKEGMASTYEDIGSCRGELLERLQEKREGS